MRKWGNVYTLLAGMLLAPASGLAQSRASGNELLRSMTDCRGLTAESDRLRCYDRATDAIIEAKRHDDIALVTKKDREAEARSTFGLPTESARAEKDSRVRPPAIETLDSTATRVAQTGIGRFLVTLADGSVWRTAESARIDPRVGDEVRVRRGALGSYLASFAGMRSLRVQRVR